jgi:hypothetical protein
MTICITENFGCMPLGTFLTILALIFLGLMVGGYFLIRHFTQGSEESEMASQPSGRPYEPEVERPMVKAGQRFYYDTSNGCTIELLVLEVDEENETVKCNWIVTVPAGSEPSDIDYLPDEEKVVLDLILGGARTELYFEVGSDKDPEELNDYAIDIDGSMTEFSE